jgi:hypothetical protein
MGRQFNAKAVWVSAAIDTAVTGEASAGPADQLIAHRAFYDLKLKHASDNSGIDGMYGRMVYEFTGSKCQGYKVRFRFVTAVEMGEEQRMTDQQTTTFEDLAHRKFDFETRSYSGDSLSQEIKGEAKADSKGVEVALKAPDSRTLELAQSSFPTEQMLEVIERARKGERFFETRVFDGSEDGDKALYTATVVGDKVSPTGEDGDSDHAGELAKAPYWPVTVAYYDDKESSDQLPSYRVSFKLYENGITRDLTMDYGDFVLTGKLANLQLLQQDACK